MGSRRRKLLCGSAGLCVLSLLVFFGLPGLFYPRPVEVLEGVDAPTPPPPTHAPREPEVKSFQDVFPRNSTLQDMLLKHGFDHEQIHRLIQDVRGVYNLNRVRAGRRLVIERFGNGTFKSLTYEISDEEYLWVEYEADRYVASRLTHDFEVGTEEIYGEIRRSLWDALVSRGESPQLVESLVDILRWDIAFTSIQPGDSFKLIVEKKYLEGQFVKYGEVSSLQFNHKNKTFYAFLFAHPGRSKKAYYDENGNAVKKSFLKVPFTFDPRITSGFSHSRYHPLLRRRRPHLGVDYAAPTGTPVLASALGKVIFAGTSGGNGKLVKIRHINGLVSSYAHLSRIRVGTGQQVTQGDVIGNVGSTGLSTGPHLDYRIQDRMGKFLNPLKFASPPAKPVEPRHWKEFTAVRDPLMQRLDSIPENEPFLNQVAAVGR